jgi:ribosomal protein S19
MLESDVTKLVLLRYRQDKGVILWRNNVGVLRNKTGRPVRFGLANESKAMNARYKSADLIGIRRVTITPDMVGQTIGVFMSVEIKATNGKAKPAQLAWRQLIIDFGGMATVEDK